MSTTSASAPASKTPFFSKRSARRVQRQAEERIFDGPGSPLGKILQRNLLGQRAPRQPAFPIAANTVNDFDGISAKNITAVGHAGRTNSIAHKQHALFPLGAPEQANYRGVDMDTIRDDLREDAIVSQYFTHNSRSPV